MLKAEYIV